MGKTIRERRDKRGEVGMHTELAMTFCRWKHRNQKRKYTGEPYYNHCYEVASILMRVTTEDEIIAAGYLHDTVEDTDTTPEEIKHFFGARVHDLVMMVTDVSKPSDGNREIRKRLDREHIAKADGHGQLIKLADMISNTSSIVKHDPSFAKIYLEEKRLLLGVIDPSLPLYNEAESLVGLA